MTELERDILAAALDMARAHNEWNEMDDGRGCRVGSAEAAAAAERERVARGRVTWLARVYADVVDGRPAGLTQQLLRDLLVTGPVVW